MTRRLPLIVLAIALAGCASMVSARGDKPKGSWTSTKSVDDLAACIIPILNEQMKAATPFDSDIRHNLQTVEPNRVYEIQPQRPVTEGAEPYFVVLTKLDGKTKVEAYGIGALALYVKKVPACL